MNKNNMDKELKNAQEQIDELKAIVEKQNDSLSKILNDNNIISPFEKKEKGKLKKYIDIIPVIRKDKDGNEIEEEYCPIIRHISAICKRNLVGHEKYTMMTVEVLNKDNKKEIVKITVEDFLRQRQRELATIESSTVKDDIKTYGTVEKKQKIGSYTTPVGNGQRVSQDVLTQVTTQKIKRDNGQTFTIKA